MRATVQLLEDALLVYAVNGLGGVGVGSLQARSVRQMLDALLLDVDEILLGFQKLVHFGLFLAELFFYLDQPNIIKLKNIN